VFLKLLSAGNSAQKFFKIFQFLIRLQKFALLGTHFFVYHFAISKIDLKTVTSEQLSIFLFKFC